MAFDVAVLAAVIGISRRTQDWPFSRAAAARVVFALLVIRGVFTQVGFVVRASGRPDHAAEVAEVDRWLFGGNDPLEALEGIAHPLVSELMQWAYVAYLVLPPAVILVLATRGARPVAERSIWSMLCIIYMTYVGYYLCPTSGPNIHSNIGAPGPCEIEPLPLYTFQSDLPGVWLKRDLEELVFVGELTKWDCMPSGHVAIAIAVAVFGFRIGRVWGWALLPICSAIVVSTVYLRYHYVVDAVAGAAVAWLCLGPLERLYARWQRRQAFAGAIDHGKTL